MGFRTSSPISDLKAVHSVCTAFSLVSPRRDHVTPSHRPSSERGLERVERRVTRIFAWIMAPVAAVIGLGWWLVQQAPAAVSGREQAGAEQTVPERSRLVLQALQASDWERLAALAHPGKGVRFSPYAFVRTDSDLVFMPDQLRAVATDETVYQWGLADGSGKPIEATLAGYLQGIARADYLSAPQVAYERILKQGNTRINIREAYPGAVFMEFHKPGAGEEADFTWSSLRLVFEQEKGVFYLVGIIRDQWTI